METKILIRKTISVIIIAAFLFTSVNVEDVFARDILVDDIATQSIFSPLANQEIKDIAMMKYVLSSGIQSDKLSILDQMEDVTSSSLGIDLGTENVQMVFHFSSAEYYERASLRLVPCTLSNGNEQTRYWCCVVEGPGEKASYKMTFFTESEKEKNDIVRRVHSLKLEQRAENLAVERAAGSELNQDEVIREAIREDQYKSVPVDHAELYVVYAFLDIVAPEVSRDFRKMVESGQLMIIGTTSSGRRLHKPHAGKQGIYLPAEEEFINSGTFIHEVFARSGFTHVECGKFENIFSEYKRTFKDDVLDTPQTLPDEMMQTMSLEERTLLARALGSMGFVDPVTFIKTRDYSSEDEENEDSRKAFLSNFYGSFGRSEEMSPTDLSSHVYAIAGHAPSEEAIEYFFKNTKVVDMFTPVKNDEILKVVSLFKAAGRDEEADKLLGLMSRKSIRMVTRFQGKDLFGTDIYGLYRNWSFPDEGDAQDVMVTSSFEVTPWVFIVSEIVGFERDKFISTLAYLTSAALGKSEEESLEFAELMGSSETVRSRGGRVPTVFEVERELGRVIDPSEKVGFEEKLSKITLTHAFKAVALMRELGMRDVSNKLKELVKANKVLVSEPRGIFSGIYGASLLRSGKENIWLAEDVSEWENDEFLPTLYYCLAGLIGLEGEDKVEFEVMASESAKSMVRVLKLLNKDEEALRVGEMAEKGRIRVISRSSVFEEGENAKYLKDSDGDPWIFIAKDVIGTNNGEQFPAVVSAISRMMEKSRSEQSQLIQTVSEDSRVMIPISSSERGVLSGIIRDFEAFRTDTSNWLRTADLAHEIRAEVWNRIVSDTLAKGLMVVDLHYLDRVEHYVNISFIGDNEGVFDKVTAVTLTSPEGEDHIKFEPLDICRHIIKRIGSNDPFKSNEEAVDYVVRGLFEDLAEQRMDQRDAQVAVDVVFQKIVGEYYQQIRGLEYVDVDTSELIRVDREPDKALVSKILAGRVEILRMNVNDDTFKVSSLVERTSVESEVARVMRELPTEPSVEKIAEVALEGIKRGVKDPWLKVSEPSAAISHRIRYEYMPQNNDNIVSLILHTITYGGFEYYSSTLTQDSSEDLHSLASVDFMNGVAAVMTGYAQMADQNPQFREILVSSFAPDGQASQRFNNILSLLKSIEFLRQVVIIPNTGKSWGAPIVDIVSTMSAASHAQNRKYHELFDTVREGIHVISPNGKIRDVNQYELSLLGYSKEEMLGRSIWEFVHPDQKEEVRARVINRGWGKDASELPERKFKNRKYLTKDGREVIVSTQDTVVYNDKGRVKEVRTVLRDITKHVEAEERTHGMLENMPSAVFFKEYDPIKDEFRFRYANSKFYEFLGIDPKTQSIAGLTEFEVREKYKKDQEDPPYNAEWYDKDDRAIFSGKDTYYKEEEIMGWNAHKAMVHRQKVRMGNGVLGVFTDISQMKQAQDALRTSEALYRNLFENMMDGFAYHEMIYDENGAAVDYLYEQVNPAFAEMLGMSEKDMLGKTVKELLPGTEEFWIDTYAEVVETGKPKRLENYSQELDKWFVVTAYRPEDGHFAVVVEDVTDRKKTALAIRESEEKYRRIVEIASDAIWETDPNGRFTFTSNRLGEMLGYSYEEISSKGMSDILTPESQNKFLDAITKEWQTPRKATSITPIIVEAEHVRSDGELIVCEISAIVVRDDEGRCVAINGTTRDITERIKLQQERAYLTSIIETTTDIATVKDLSGRIITVNHAFVDQLPRGTLKSDVIGKTDVEVFKGLVDDETLQGYLDDEEFARKGKVVDKIEKIPGGRIVHTRKFPIYRGKEIIATANISRDITENQRIKESLQEARERFETVFRSNPLPILVFDSVTHRCVNANDAACELYGYSLAEFKELSPEDLRKGELIMRDNELERHAHAPVRRDRGEALHFESEQIKRDGQTFSAKLTMFNFNVDRDLLMGFIVEDVTEMKRTQQRLSDEMLLAKLSNDVMHELMTARDMDKAARMLREELDLFGATFALIKPGTETLEVLGSDSGFPMVIQTAIRRLNFDLSKNAKARKFFDAINGPMKITRGELVEMISDESALKPILIQGLTRVLLEEDFGEMFLFPFKDNNGEKIGVILLSKQEDGVFRNNEKEVLGHLMFDIGLLLDRDRIAQTLASAEEEYRTVVENVQRPIIRVSTKGDIQFMNEYAIEHLDLEGEGHNYRGKTLWDIFPKDIADERMRHINDVISLKCKTISSETGMEDGEEKWYRSINHPQIDPVTGEVISVIIIMSDVTTYKRAAAALKESEERYKALVSLDPDAIAMTQDKKFVFVNQALANLLGVGSDDLIGKGIDDFATEESLVKMWEEHDARLSGEKKFSIYEADLVDSDGGIIPVEISAGVIRHKGKQACLLSIRDITERKKAERERVEYQRKLLEAAKQWESTFNSTSEMFALLGADKELIRVNKAFCDVVGKTPEELVGNRCCDFIHGAGSSAEERCSLLEAERAKGSVENSFYEPSLGIWLEVLVSPILSDEGEIIGYVHISRDVTERKRIEKELEEYRTDLEAKVDERTRELERINKELELKKRLAALGQMAAGIAHEVRNPVTSAAGMIRVFKETGDVSLLDDALSELDRSNRIVEDLLGYSREEGDKLQPVRYADLLQEAVIKCRNVIEEYGVRVKVDVDGEDIVIMANSDRLLQVYINLITNACHAMEGRHQRDISILLSTDTTTNQAVVNLMDTGSGMTDETIEKLFSPFFTTKKAGKGTGLGMALVQKIVSAHSGRIDLYSVVNQGTNFTVRIPLAEKEVVARAVEDDDDGSSENEPVRQVKTILLADDLLHMRKIWGLLAKKKGVKVVSASGVSEALKLFDENDIDAVITDVNMEDSSVDGFILAVLLRGKGFKGPIAVATAGDVNEERIINLREAGIINAAFAKTSKYLSSGNVSDCISQLERCPEEQLDIAKVNEYSGIIKAGNATDSMFGLHEREEKYHIISSQPKWFVHEVRTYINALSVMEYLPVEVQRKDTDKLSGEMLAILSSFEEGKDATSDMREALRLTKRFVAEFQKLSKMFKNISEWDISDQLKEYAEEYSEADLAEYEEYADLLHKGSLKGYEFLEGFLAESRANIEKWSDILEARQDGSKAAEAGGVNKKERVVVNRSDRHDLRNALAGLYGNVELLSSLQEDGVILTDNFKELSPSLKGISRDLDDIPPGHIEDAEEALAYLKKYMELIAVLRDRFAKVAEANEWIYEHNAQDEKFDISMRDMLLSVHNGIGFICNEDSDVGRKIISLQQEAVLKMELLTAELSAAEDIEGKSAFNALLSSAEREFIEEVDRSFVGIMLLNFEGYAIFGNRSSMDILGKGAYSEIEDINFIGSPALSAESIENLKNGKAAVLSIEELAVLKKRGLIDRDDKDLEDIFLSITPLAMDKGASAGFIIQLHDRKREEEVTSSDNVGASLDIVNMINAGRASALPSKAKALELQMMSAEKVALVFGSQEKGIKMLRRAGFNGEIRFARDIEELAALNALGKLSDVDIVINTTKMDIKTILRNMDLEVEIVDDMTDANLLQNTLLEVCA